MGDVIVFYESPTGGVHLLIPSADAGLSIEEIIEKDVPEGARHLVVARDRLPARIDAFDACRTIEDVVAVLNPE